MKCPLELLFIISLLPAASRALRCARTSLAEDSPQKNQTCVFPFTVGNNTYPECTRNHDDFGQPWCSTKVDSNGKHVSGSEHWGYCDPGKINPYQNRPSFFIFNNKIEDNPIDKRLAVVVVKWLERWSCNLEVPCLN